MPIRLFLKTLVHSILFASISVLAVQSALAQQKIGLSLPLTGQAEPLARQFLIGAQAALSAEPQPGGATLVVVDDACDELVAQVAAAELLKSQVNLVTGFLCNISATVVANQMVASQIPLLVAGARSERLIKDREKESWNLWRLTPGDNDAARYAAEVLGKSWQNSAYAIVDDGTVYGRNLADAFRTVMDDQGLPPQFQDNFRPTQSTQARLVRRLRNAGITHVFIGAAAEDVAMIAKNANELNIALEIAGGEVLSIMPYLPQDTLPPDGLMAVIEKTMVDLDLPESIRQQFAEDNIEPEPYVLAGYQAVQIALAALRSTPQETTSALSQETFETLLGPVSFNSDGTSTTQHYGFYQWRNNQFMQVIQ